jgi:hypothetical protein
VPDRDDERAVHEHFVRGLGEATRHNSLAFGYSLALTGAFGVLAILVKPTVVDVFLFGIGGSLTFTIANVAVTRGFTVQVEGEPPIVRAIGTSVSFASVSGGIGAAALFAWVLGGWPAWLVGSFAASAVYLVLTALELVLARGVRVLLGREKLEER